MFEVREEAVDRSLAALGVEVFVAEAHEGVGVLAPFLRHLGVDGEVGEVLAERSPRCGARGLAQCVERDLHLGPSRKRPPPRTRNGTPARLSASSNAADCALMRYSTAMRRHGRSGPSRGAHRAGHATRLGFVGLVVGDRGAGPSGRVARTVGTATGPGPAEPSTTLAAVTTCGVDR